MAHFKDGSEADIDVVLMCANTTACSGMSRERSKGEEEDLELCHIQIFVILLFVRRRREVAINSMEQHGDHIK